jgi:PucR C-terminal helix-turn-helix domain/GGDEF-like domain
MAMDWLGGSRRSELLRALIEGSGDPAQAIRALGLRSDRRYCLLALFSFGSDGGHGIGHRRELLAAHLELFDRASVTSWIGNTLYALAPVASDDDLTRLAALSRRVADDRLLRHSAGVAVGSPRSVQAHLTDARAEVLGLIEVYQSSLGPGQVIAGWQSEAAVMTRRAGKLLTADPSMAFAKMTALEQYDASHSGSGLVETLTTYLDSGMNVSRSAAAMHLHHTTMRYRLQRISEISGLDLDDPAERLAVQLHCLRNGVHPRRLRPGTGPAES